ncbi:MAG: hypothetical protein IT191_07485 [Microbacteriaceae bacterium]|nr:hypothetical protein [Microbacteriaceae bacterium]
MRRGYAVLDLETTGLSPKYGDRIVEVGAVYLTPDLRLEGSIETIVNPKRDVGPTSIHGLTATDVLDAPTFDQVAPIILDMLDGRVLVGHNIRFDLNFLNAELSSEGYEIPEVVSIDTLLVARKLLDRAWVPSFKLHDVARYFGITTEAACEFAGVGPRAAHSALGDALVTALSLCQFIHASPKSGFWDSHLDSAEKLIWPERVFLEVKEKRRDEKSEKLELSTLAVIEAVSATSLVAPSTELYSDRLNEVLEDRVLDPDELDQLIKVARDLGFDKATLGSLHRGVFDGIVQEAWLDGKLSIDERKDIQLVAELLGIEIETMMSAMLGGNGSEQLTLPAGSVIVLTGEMSKPREEVESEILARGFVVGGSVSKKTALVIAADPNTQSGKAKRARDLGIPILGEGEGLSLIRS